jgi:mRNA-degrading endonuclease RelE of RelBE toxin-antitoxin system
VGALEGLYSARRGDFRIIYEIDEAELVVIVHRIQHRADVYRPDSRPPATDQRSTRNRAN